MQLLIKLFLWINNFFPEIKHPFNQPKADGTHFLNYGEFEFETASQTFEKYENIFGFKNWIKEKEICDFACGGGGKSLYLLKLGAEKVTGIDLNEVFIDQARELAKKKTFENKSEFIIGNVCETNFPDASFDGVIMNDAIDHFDNPPKALDEAFRITKPGGFIFINFESYLFPYGHHMLDGVRIPWIHLFTTEKFRMALYAKAIEEFPDAQERLEFKKNYLNRLTFRKFTKILNEFEVNDDMIIFAQKKLPLRRKIFQFLSKIPLISELFLGTGIWILQKKGAYIERDHRPIQQVKIEEKSEYLTKIV